MSNTNGGFVSVLLTHLLKCLFLTVLALVLVMAAAMPLSPLAPMFMLLFTA